MSDENLPRTNHGEREVDAGACAVSCRQPLSPAAERALAEAEDRRRAATVLRSQREIGGRGGRDPARYGDWEINGRAIDF